MTSIQHSPFPKAGAPIGPLLQYWRKTRNLSQLGLAHEADVSPRHICFIETGRAKPSREMVLLLCDVLDVPLRERNGLLLAAGFAPIYAETPLEAPELGAVQSALLAILRQQEPYPAVVMNRSWDLSQSNDAARRFFGMLLGEKVQGGPANIIRMMFSPEGLRPFVTNWEAVAESLLQRLRRETVGGVIDPATASLLDEVLNYADVPKRLRLPDPGRPMLPVIPVCFSKDGQAFNFFSTVTTLGTPQDVTLQEMRIECFFPADAETEAQARALQ